LPKYLKCQERPSSLPLARARIEIAPEKVRRLTAHA